ncbi:HVA22-like protein c [Salvia hispanica]|uniref:HVA22-like protein c n=1 Tax=Salvia hispanica TaxID=49212 RepID=UPI002009221E|nr:HVA22-like protein c [Salvia hispanica]
MGLLTFALLNLGWPAIALCYPLYHMRKMVEYWTLFSLFSLFEFAFVKINEWTPFWPGIRLAVSLMLVMPQFEGAGLVRPFIHGFGILNEERLCKRKAFLDVVEWIRSSGKAYCITEDTTRSKSAK